MRNGTITARLAALLMAVSVSISGFAFAGEEMAPAPFTRVYGMPNSAVSVKGTDGGLYVTVGEESVLYSPSGGCPKAPHPDDPVDAPLCATMEQVYPAGPGHRAPADGFNPGRVRNEAFMKALYGHSAEEVESQLVPVSILGETVRFSSRHGAAEALGRVARKLETLAARDPALKAYLLPFGGTYAWRKISKSPRLSAHSFGICIDLNIDKGIYWQWKPTEAAIRDARDNYPQSIVDAFESEGFIWGGKWHAFDYMHFEYRPEFFTQ